MTQADFAIRPERPGDEAGVRAVNLAAFATPEEADLVDALRDSDAWLPGGSIVAVEACRVVGHLLLTRATLVAPDRPPQPIVALAPMAVLPDRQGRGIGSGLVRAAIARAMSTGERLIVVLGYPEFYARFGFRPGRPLGIHPPLAWPETAWMALFIAQSRSAADRSSVLRGTVRYAAAFGVND